MCHRSCWPMRWTHLKDKHNWIVRINQLKWSREYTTITVTISPSAPETPVIQSVPGQVCLPGLCQSCSKWRIRLCGACGCRWGDFVKHGHLSLLLRLFVCKWRTGRTLHSASFFIAFVAWSCVWHPLKLQGFGRLPAPLPNRWSAESYLRHLRFR